MMAALEQRSGHQLKMQDFLGNWVWLRLIKLWLQMIFEAGQYCKLMVK